MTLSIEYLKLLYRAAKYRYADDGDEIRFLLSVIQKGSTVFDIGAHKGGYTYWMKKAVGSKGKLIAFEPQEKGYRLIRNLFNEEVIVEHLALSDKEGEQKLYIQPQRFDVSFEASLEKNYEGSHIETIRTVSLDSYCERQQLFPDFIKIDVEGHERKVLEGGKKLLETNKPTLLLESEVRHTGEPSLQSLFKFLQSLGYQGSFFYQHKRFPLAQFSSLIHQANPQSRDYVNNFIFE